MSVLGKQTLDGRRCDELALNSLEVVFDTAGNKNKSVIVDFYFIPGVQPAILPKLCGLFRAVVVAGGAALCLDQQFAIVANLDFDLAYRPANGAYSAV